MKAVRKVMSFPVPLLLQVGWGFVAEESGGDPGGAIDVLAMMDEAYTRVCPLAEEEVQALLASVPSSSKAIQSELGNGLDACRSAWTSILSLHGEDGGGQEGPDDDGEEEGDESRSLSGQGLASVLRVCFASKSLCTERRQHRALRAASGLSSPISLSSFLLTLAGFLHLKSAPTSPGSVKPGSPSSLDLNETVTSMGSDISLESATRSNPPSLRGNGGHQGGTGSGTRSRAGSMSGGVRKRRKRAGSTASRSGAPPTIVGRIQANKARGRSAKDQRRSSTVFIGGNAAIELQEG